MSPLRLTSAVAVTLAALTPAPCRADFIDPLVGADTPEQFFGTVRFVEPRNQYAAGQIVFNAVNWMVTVKQSRTDDFPFPRPGGLPLRVADDIEVLAIHLIPPPTHGEGMGRLIEVADFLDVTPGQPVRNRAGRPDGVHSIRQLHQFAGSDHIDTLEVMIVPLNDGTTSRIFINAQHTGGPVPAPPAAVLFGIGLVGLFCRARSR